MWVPTGENRSGYASAEPRTAHFHWRRYTIGQFARTLLGSVLQVDAFSTADEYRRFQQAVGENIYLQATYGERLGTSDLGERMKRPGELLKLLMIARFYIEYHEGNSGMPRRSYHGKRDLFLGILEEIRPTCARALREEKVPTSDMLCDQPCAEWEARPEKGPIPSCALDDAEMALEALASTVDADELLDSITIAEHEKFDTMEFSGALHPYWRYSAFITVTQGERILGLGRDAELSDICNHILGYAIENPLRDKVIALRSLVNPDGAPKED